MRGRITLAILGLALGIVLGPGGAWQFSALVGAALGYLLGDIQNLRRKIDALGQPDIKAPGAPTPAESRPIPPPAEPLPTEAAAAIPAAARISVTPKATPQEAAPRTAAVTEPDWLNRLSNVVKQWFTTGNVPVKVGAIISFFGFGFLLKYAVDNELLLLSIEFRLLGVAAVAITLTVVGWRMRERLRVYALSLQGTGTGILYLTIFAAMRLYGLIPPGLAFVLLIVLTLSSGAIAVLQNSRALAILGIVGGFLAPILVSTGTGNHVVLFSYYLVLNAAILGIAWFRAWRELNVIGFGFTFIIGGIWGYQNYSAELFASTEPFLVVYFIFYLAIAILFASRQPPELKGVVDGTLVFGTPVIAFALQSVLVEDFEYGLAISAATVALLYAVTAKALFRARGGQFRLLVEAFLAMAVAFGTITIPLALDARWTAAAWALEGAALIWVGVRQNRILARASGSLLVIASGISFAISGWDSGEGLAVLNGNFLGGLLISTASLFSAHYLGRDSDRFAELQRLAAGLLFFWGVLWWLGSGLAEINDRIDSGYFATASSLYFAASSVALLLVGQRLDWNIARKTTLAYILTLFIPISNIAVTDSHPAAYLGWLSWPAAFAAQYFILWSLRERFRKPINVLHTITLLALSGLLMWEVAWQVDRADISRTWTQVAAGLVPGVLATGVIYFRDRINWPLETNRAAYLLAGCGALIGVQLLIVMALSAISAGGVAPLDYVPLLNPLDLLTAFALLLALRWLLMPWVKGRFADRDWRLGIEGLAIVAFATSTSAVIRALHHLGGVAWDAGILLSSVLVQAALSIYWGLLAFVGMVWGARGGRREVWLASAGLMGIVVVKLFLVDLGNTGTLARIVSFIGIGALLLAVGYFAPAPPRQRDGVASDAVSEDA